MAQLVLDLHLLTAQPHTIPVSCPGDRPRDCLNVQFLYAIPSPLLFFLFFFFQISHFIALFPQSLSPVRLCRGLWRKELEREAAQQAVTTRGRPKGPREDDLVAMEDSNHPLVQVALWSQPRLHDAARKQGLPLLHPSLSSPFHHDTFSSPTPYYIRHLMTLSGFKSLTIYLSLTMVCKRSVFLLYYS